jgi:opacity protein-like surface antigen
MRKNFKTGCGHLSVLTFLLTLFVTLPVYGEDDPNSAGKWEFRFMPYFWLPSLNADSTVSGLSGSVDLSCGDVLDYLDMAAMGRMEVWKDKWGLSFDGVYMNLGASKSFQGRRGLANFDLDADVRVGMADFALTNRLWEKSFGNHNQQKLTFEPYGGLRYGYLRQKIDVNIDIPGVGSAGRTLGTSEDWVEPFAGGRLIWDLNDQIALNVRGDAGGFGIGSASDLTWQILGGMDYKFTKNIILNVGYRYVDLDYSHGSGSDEFGIHLKAQGPIMGLTIIF